MNYNKYLLEYQKYIGKNGKTKYKFDSPEEMQSYRNFRKASTAYNKNHSNTSRKEQRLDDRDDFLNYYDSEGLKQETNRLNKLNAQDEYDRLHPDEARKRRENERLQKKLKDDPNYPQRQKNESRGAYNLRVKEYNQNKANEEKEQLDKKAKETKEMIEQKQREADKKHDDEMRQRQQIFEQQLQNNLNKAAKKRNLKKASIIGGTAVAAGIAGKIAFDRIQYNKYKKRHPNITFSKWKQLKKQKRLNESFLDGYYDALNYYL